MGGKPELRMGVQKDGPVITDNGNFIVDTKFDSIRNPQKLEKELNILPGVVENGIFTNLVDKVIIGSPSGIKEINKDDIL